MAADAAVRSLNDIVGDGGGSVDQTIDYAVDLPHLQLTTIHKASFEVQRMHNGLWTLKQVLEGVRGSRELRTWRAAVPLIGPAQSRMTSVIAGSVCSHALVSDACGVGVHEDSRLCLLLEVGSGWRMQHDG